MLFVLSSAVMGSSSGVQNIFRGVPRRSMYAMFAYLIGWIWGVHVYSNPMEWVIETDGLLMPEVVELSSFHTQSTPPGILWR